MLVRLRAIAKEKGQGIVEYAILLAFIVGLAAMLMGNGGIKDAVIDTFDRVATFIACTTPEGRLAADKARIKKLGEAIAANFKRNNNNVIDDYTKADSYAVLKGEYISILVLSDGSVNIFTGTGGNGKWLTELDQATRDEYVSALKNAGINLNDDPYISTTAVLNGNNNMGKTQYYTDTNLKPYSSGDETGLNNGYAISFTQLNGKMQLKYYELNNPYTKEDLGTRYVPRSYLRDGTSNGAPSEETKAKYPNNPTSNLFD